MKKETLTAIFAGIAAFILFVILLPSCSKKDSGCYTCKVYGQQGVQSITTICDESQVKPFRDAYKGTGLGVSCQKN